jgi:arabinan endo-1,5-alpha-L-arabinosidase
MSRIKIKLLLLGAILIIAGTSAYFIMNSRPALAPTVFYQNPVFEPVLADPSVIKAEDGYFYAYGTEDDWADGQGEKLVPVIRSKDLVHWDYIGEAFEQKPMWSVDEGGELNPGIWAPDISYFNGKYYLYYSLSIWADPNPGIGVATSDSPTGPFKDHGKLFTSIEIGVPNSIDPMLYMDDGTPYLFWGSFNGIYGVELTKDGISLAGEKFQIASSDFEASYIIKRDGYYYYFGSLGACCEGVDSTYHVAVGRSKSIMGPYVNQNGADIRYNSGKLILWGHHLTDAETGDGKQFVGPGHNAVIQDDEGHDWIVYHAYDKSYALLGNGTLRRALMIDRIVWEDGWPSIKDSVPSTTKQEGPVIHN